MQAYPGTSIDALATVDRRGVYFTQAEASGASMKRVGVPVLTEFLTCKKNST
jgi:hypothetical protein